jgi:hypothetical protein
MVRSLLAGTKTQTRRVMTVGNAAFGGAPRDFWAHGNFAAAYVDGRAESGQYLHVPCHVEVGPACDCPRCLDMGWPGTVKRLWPRIEVGDRLYVREAWRTFVSLDKIAPRDIWAPNLERGAGIYYETGGNLSITKGLAGREWIIGDDEMSGGAGKFRQAMHMPRWASRLTLTVTEVRVQRVQEISEAGARAEGATLYEPKNHLSHGGWSHDQWHVSETPRASYESIWDSLNADRGFGWSINPWVVAVSFTVERRNIDEAPL